MCNLTKRGKFGPWWAGSRARAGDWSRRLLGRVDQADKLQTQGGLALLGRNRQPVWLGRAGWENRVSPWKGSGLDSGQSLEV